jgi:ATP-binding cassette subfamily F protein 3
MQINNFEKIFGDKILFDKTTVKLSKGDKIALLGQNGTGKTTLFRCIAGLESYEGEIVFDGTVAVMEQEKHFDTLQVTFNDYLASKQEVIETRMRELESLMGEPSIYEHENKYNKVLYEHMQLSSRTQEAVERQDQVVILDSLGYDETILDRPIADLSGGEKTALRLTEVLSKHADILLLDEPTNHLDYTSIKWLEQKLRRSEQTIFIVSHDRFFLNSFVSVVLEIENKQLVKYKGNYDYYLQARVEHRDLIAKKRERIETKRKSLLDSAEQKRTWAHKNGNKSMRMQADRLEREANDLPILPDLQEDIYSFRLKGASSLGKLAFELKQVSKSYDEPVLQQVSVSLENYERVGIIGENGSGKSTLLNLLAGLIEPTSGTIYTGQKVQIGYFDQEGEALPKRKTVRDYLLEINASLPDHKIDQLAKDFGLAHDFAKKKIGALSGGEKSRLQLMTLLQGSYNVLLLDEPTNHLDLELRESLEAALRKFPGLVVFISHDRYFVEKVATQLLQVQHGQVVQLAKGAFR